MDYQQLPSVQALAIAGLPTSGQSAPHQQLQHIMQNNNVQQNVQQLLTSMQPPPLPSLASLNPINQSNGQNLAMQQINSNNNNNNNGINTHSNVHTLAHLNNLLVNNQNHPNIGVAINNNNNPSMPNNNLHNVNNTSGNSNGNNGVQQPLPPQSQLLQLHHQNVLNNNNNNNNTINNNNVAALVNGSNNNNNNNNNSNIPNNNIPSNNNNNIALAEEGNRWTQFQVQQLWRHHAYLNGKSGNSKDICGDDKFKEDGDPWNVEAQAAFLGPNLWDKTLPYDTDLKYADLDEFLSENNIPEGLPGSHLAHSTSLGGHRSDSLGHSTGLLGLGHITTKRERSPSPSDCVSPDTINPPSPAESTFSFASSGRDFDPRTRAFSDEELKPQPMIKKSRKQFVPDELKDDKYWARRRKNNIAAKRSRDARRQKENQIAMRARYLEKEVLLQNSTLHQELEQLKQENMELRARLSKYQDV